ncbi:heavy-metal-associated domain-containing protein [Microbacterium sp. ZXX196]|uniref:heavy-metal-associated domain-containing protein n=1 Tax=Microbacterium sp. ZXX196 TaxID=2609291 RepID=UPI0012B9E324|nr:heavy metal-associated domain-containing protein [Microbacterium sp. ZXX196]MTE24601.1 heavy metal transporter [Microbacterium sp. ZXX196]
MATSEYKVTGMTCGHCEMSVREEVGGIAGVESVEVDAQTGRLVVHAATEIGASAVISAVEEAGYSAARV